MSLDGITRIPEPIYCISLHKTVIPRRLCFNDIDFLNKYSECYFKHVTVMVKMITVNIHEYDVSICPY
jgi:hypothetical protein